MKLFNNLGLYARQGFKKHKRREIISLQRNPELFAQRFAYLTLLRFFANIRLPPECVTHCHAFPLDKNAAFKNGR
ncbi:MULTISPECIES: hypothetical protein [Pseudomonas]|uniref:hypothetical protein n=1 Tax=Pseudomonas TaxID=286 RepID=UPI000A4DD913|nr:MULTISPECIES: hypothetical protein [Pseudomonas]MDU8459448.1 hypothetical protein [Pseudomonas syringae group sp. J254-4]QXW43310.1 hypothetical protein KXJ79_16505 [Pseudomonas amygdali]UFI43317.1 hypothetical protein KP808_16095 [Pseudomonas savastanoi]